jgi:hypothetical protein
MMNTIEEYREFLQKKKTTVPESGFEVEESELNPKMNLSFMG